MDKALKVSIESLIKSKRGFEFESLINQIYLICYGADGYQPTREKRDDGAEGIVLRTRTIIAAYGPDSYDEKKFLKKINDDFDDYLQKWAAVNKRWKMHYNGSLPPEALRLSDVLKAKADKNEIKVDEILIQGIEQLMQFIEENYSNKSLRQLAEHLGVAKELIIFDHIRSIIDDLIRDVGIDPENIAYKLQVNVFEKIELNYSDDDVMSAKEEYQELATSGTIKKIWGVISTYEPEEINALKLKIKREFNAITGSFKDKVGRLVENYMNKYSSGQDDDFEYYTRALFTYCFEQCMIGNKIKSEEDKHLI